MRRTKIVATLGPASGSPEVLGSLLDAGADMVRLGLAHGTVDEHLAAIDLVRRDGRAPGPARWACSPTCPVPRCAPARSPTGGAFLAEGDEVTLAAGEGDSDSGHISVDEARLTDIVSPRAPRSCWATAR